MLRTCCPAAVLRLLTLVIQCLRTGVQRCPVDHLPVGADEATRDGQRGTSFWPPSLRRIPEKLASFGPFSASREETHVAHSLLTRDAMPPARTAARQATFARIGSKQRRERRRRRSRRRRDGNAFGRWRTPSPRSGMICPLLLPYTPRILDSSLVFCSRFPLLLLLYTRASDPSAFAFNSRVAARHVHISLLASIPPASVRTITASFCNIQSNNLQALVAGCLPLIIRPCARTDSRVPAHQD